MGEGFPKDSGDPIDCVFILITCHFYPGPSKLCPGERSTCEARSPDACESYEKLTLCTKTRGPGLSRSSALLN